MPWDTPQVPSGTRLPPPVRTEPVRWGVGAGGTLWKLEEPTPRCEHAWLCARVCVCVSCSAMLESLQPHGL